MITTLVGNYPKVSEQTYSTKLIGSIAKWQRKELSNDGLESVVHEITRAVIKEQEEVGIDVLTDGQIGWEDLVTPIAGRLDGFEINGLTRFFNNNVYYRRPVLNAAPKRRSPLLVPEYLFAKQCTTRPVKAILPGPYTFVQLSEDRFFKSARKFTLAMAEILNAEARALAEAGAPLVQFDEPAIGFGKTDIKLAVEALNIATQGVASATAVYTYFGSLDGALASLQKARFDILGIDIVSDPKSLGSLRKTKLTKELALGCVDARNTKLESVTELHAVFNVVKKRVPLDRLHVNPNCGLEFLPHPQAFAKMQRLAQAVATYR